MSSLDFGNSSKGGLFSSLGRYLERSTVVDLATVMVLGMNFLLLQEHMGFGDSILEFSTDPAVIAPQATALMIIIYLAETLADKNNH